MCPSCCSAERRAGAEGLPLRTQVADAQQLPFDDAAFDVVTSTFRVMFAPNQARTASELLRVLRGGGRLGMANWTPRGWAGAQFRLQAQILTPPPGLVPPSAWGTEERLRELFGDRVSSLESRREHAEFCHHDTSSLLELFREWFGLSQRSGARWTSRSGGSSGTAGSRSPANSTSRGTGPARSPPSI